MSRAALYAALAMVLCGGAVGCDLSKKQREALAEGDRLYPTDPAAAAWKYKEGYPAAGPRKAEVLRRIVDQDAGAGETAGARKWIEVGLDDKLDVAYETPAARDLLAAARAERAKKQEAKEAEERAAQEAKEKRERYGDAGEATTAAHMLVKRHLAFPAEARFNFSGRNTSQRADGSWSVAGDVTSKNAFGVKVKFRFQVALARQANGDWQEVEPVTLVESD